MKILLLDKSSLESTKLEEKVQSVKGLLKEAEVEANDEELEDYGHLPICIMGDFNADVQDLPMVEEMLSRGSWIDVGDVAHVWGGKRAQPTCRAGRNKATRRDYALANAAMAPMIRAFEVESSDEFATHSPITIKIEITDGTPQTTAQPSNFTTHSTSVWQSKHLARPRAVCLARRRLCKASS